MVGKIVNHLNSINTYSKKIIVWTSMISLVLCFIGVGIIIYDNSVGATLLLHNIGSTLIYSAIVLFTQFIIGSLVIDFFSAILNNED